MNALFTRRAEYQNWLRNPIFANCLWYHRMLYGLASLILSIVQVVNKMNRTRTIP
jgi:hypothetical protein